MRANGRATKLMAKVNWCMQTAMSMKENGLTTKLKVTAPTVTRMALSMRDHGSTISSTGRALNRGPMVLATKANTLKARRKEMVV